MNGLFRWSMRYGARILFAVALIQLIAGLLLALFQISTNSHAMGDSILIEAATILLSVAGAALPLFGALVIERVDRWLALKGAAE